MDHDLLTVVDGNDTVLGYSTKDDVNRRGLNYRCVQIFLFNSKNELLICRRPETKKRYALQFSSVMGHVKKGESYEEAAYRETGEELGIKTRLRRVAKFSLLDGASRVFQEIYQGGIGDQIEQDTTEISETRFISLKDLKTDIVMNKQRYALPFIEALRAYMKAENIY